MRPTHSLLFPAVAAAVAGWISAGCAASATAPSARPEPVTVALEAARDATLVESADGSLANGSGTALFVGRTGQPRDSRRRALLAFDLAGSLPAGATITTVELTLELTHTHAGEEPVSLHRVTASWSEGPAATPGGRGAPAEEGDVTWIHRRRPEELWKSPGGDFEARASATSSPGGPGGVTWASTPALVADAQEWLDSPEGNFGWLLLGNEETSGSAKSFRSRESDEGPPRLTVTYRPPS